jgi:hypothetical protein
VVNVNDELAVKLQSKRADLASVRVKLAPPICKCRVSSFAQDRAIELVSLECALAFIIEILDPRRDTAKRHGSRF